MEQGGLKAPVELPRERAGERARKSPESIGRFLPRIRAARARVRALFTHKHFEEGISSMRIDLSLPFFFRPGARYKGHSLTKFRYAFRDAKCTRRAYIVYVSLREDSERELLTRSNTWLNSSPAACPLLFSGCSISQTIVATHRNAPESTRV